MKPKRLLLNRTGRLVDFVLYMLISIGVIGVLLIAIWFKVDKMTIMNGVGFVFLTALVFGYFISDSRLLWGSHAFWVLTIFLLAVHSLGFWEVVRKVGFFKPGWYPVVVFELILLFFLRNRLLSDNS